ncbi:molybdate ABC transporter substrate-binding protein [Spiractinospora alimapuensis]|uniref:molybdate ABC transporter substrate-binding protein n=1 Tax=Spiractinospora alimapuensis TaxID=2820884 RepID=UPI001F29F3E8|nr:molybdate ABC transporter substrate-binding protein [Spiractinospora alimapuensis]QVQ54483.1 molybdate ABC transporter substrate-binding protein [Spiractinospora alimapuensis]
MPDPTPRRPFPLSVTLAAVPVAVAVLATAACGDVPGDDGGGDAEGGSGNLRVFAAASLTDVFGELGERFEEEHGVTVDLNFAGSSELAQQINEGAPADVFASANPANMDLVAEEGNVAGEETVFVENILEIAVPADNPAGVEELDDLAADDVVVALCSPEVPCGAASETVMEDSGVDIDPATLEEDVRAALTKVELGEVDAALVYRTDVMAAGESVVSIEFPEAEEAVNDYPIAVLTEAAEPDLAEEWVRLVTSDEGQAVLTDAGFRTP